MNKKNKIIESFEKNIKDCECIIELGANIGSITKKLIKHGKTVYAFEPDPEAFKELSLIKSPNLIKKNYAAWIKDGTSILYRHKDWINTKSHTSSSLNLSKINVDDKNSIICKTVDIADFIISLKQLTLLKIDIEGAEYEVMNHLLKKNAFDFITKVYCEFHPHKIKFGYLKHLKLKIRLFFSGNSKKVENWF